MADSTSNAAITKRFSLKQLLLGVALALAGAALAAGTVLLADRISLYLVAFGVLLIAIGLGVAASSNANACASCREPLEGTSTALPIIHDPELVAAVQAAPAGVDGILELCSAPFPPTNTPIRSCLLVRSCPKCRAVAEISSAKQKQLPDGGTTEHDISTPVVVLGLNVSRLLDAIGARNEAWSKAMYGGGG